MVKMIFFLDFFLRLLGLLFDFLRETVNTSQGRLRGLKIGFGLSWPLEGRLGH